MCFNPQPGGVPILVAFYDMHGLQWNYSSPLSPHGEFLLIDKDEFKRNHKTKEQAIKICNLNYEKHLNSFIVLKHPRAG
jgi:hypothetical protein